MVEMKIPAVGESITEVTVANWHKKDGDFVKMDEVIAELESDKATFELPAEAEGILRHKAKEGDTLAIGAVIALIESVNAPAAKAQPTAEAPAPAPAAPAPTPAAAPAATASPVVEVKVPALGESITEVTVSALHKKNGDSVRMDEAIAELESDKATFELPAEAAGTIQWHVSAGQTVAIGAVVASISVGTGTVAAVPTPPAAPAAAPAAATEGNYAAGHPSPAASKILEEKGIQASDVAGSGVGGRITKADAQAAMPAAKPAPAPAAATQAKAPTASGLAGRAERRERMSSLRKTIARRLVSVKNETAMLTTFNEVDMKPIMDLRNKFKDKFKEKHGVGLGFMSFFTKAVCVALKEYPAINASIDGDEIVFRDYTDISIAVSAPRGLVVPVIRNADQMNFAQIEQEIVTLATKARDNKLTLEEMTGGTFTITNGGVFGSMLSTPIINAPQVAILGMHNIVERAVVVNGEIVVRPIMYVALSYDHRIIDGRESVSFLVRVKQILEDPTRLLLDV
jgi:2-oxoglutarate dehydrogenase E2 component (dihydrolipoamide succinyltransferase)